MFRIWWLAFIAIATLAASPALAETRIALVIGNANYDHAPRLLNPPNDIAAVAVALRQAGFSSVTIRQNLTGEQFKAALLEFSRAARNADVAVVDYSGHGIEVGGVNYLVPVDATLAADTDVDFEAVPLDMVLHAVENARRLRLVLLDACRSNPFANTMARTNATRAIGRGLARVEPSSDTLVVYAARAGSTATDGNDGISPFSAAFARDVVQPGVEINKLFRLVHDQVMAATNPKQEPFVYGSLSAEDYYFVPPLNPTPSPVLPAAPVAPDATQVEVSMWNSVSGSNAADQLNLYLKKYPAGMFADIARAKIAALSRPAPPSTPERPNLQVASLPPAPVSTALLTKSDFQSVLGLTRNSTLDNAVGLFGQYADINVAGSYEWNYQGESWLHFIPGDGILVNCGKSPYIDPNSPVGRLCARDDYQRSALLSEFQPAAGFLSSSGNTFQWESGDVYLDLTGTSVYLTWHK